MQENPIIPPSHPSSTNSVPNKNPNLTGSRVCPRCGSDTDQRYCYACGCDLDPIPMMPASFAYPNQMPTAPMTQNYPYPPQQPIMGQSQMNTPPQQPAMGQPQMNVPPQQPAMGQPQINYQQGNPYAQQPYYSPQYPMQMQMQPQKKSYWWIWIIVGVIGLPMIIAIIVTIVSVMTNFDDYSSLLDGNKDPYYDEGYNQEPIQGDIFPGGISQREFSQIAKGMTYARVSKIIGGDGALTDNGTTPQGKSYYIYTWPGEFDENAYVHITFIDDVVSDIVDDGLF